MPCTRHTSASRHQPIESSQRVHSEGLLNSYGTSTSVGGRAGRYQKAYYKCPVAASIVHPGEDLLDP
eukprot:scaffold1219_cov400-Prasinococcus_capsulatus_cf.AAC.14